MRAVMIFLVMAVAAVAASREANACVGLGCSCSVSAPDLSFGVYNPLAAAAVTSGASIGVTCSTTVLGVLVSYSIGLGTGSSGNYSSRTLTSGVNTLHYNLYTSPGYTTVWGNGSGGSATVSDGYLLNILSRSRSYPVYARLPGSQNVAVGSYSDTIVVTITY